MDDSDSNYYGTGGSNDPDEAQISVTGVQRSLGRIVVGVDRLAGSEAALDWADSEAHLRGVPVHAVMTRQEPQIYGADGIPADVSTLPSIKEGPKLAHLTDRVPHHRRLALRRARCCCRL